MSRKMSRILVQLGLRRSALRTALPFVAAGTALALVGAAGVYFYPRIRDLIRERTTRAHANGAAHEEAEYAGNYPT